ncbi:hypothetical protein [Terriglobus roseus]|nr:hypothetical protein [Terriglobus roseus]
MKTTKARKPTAPASNLQRALDDIQLGQRNSTWPDVLKSSKSADEAFWKGSRDAPLVQRIGVMIFALAFLITAVGLMFLSHQDEEPLIAVFSLFPLGVGLLFFRNALLH